MIDPRPWLPENAIAFDFETSGTLPEYALQPWRYTQKKFWATSLVWAGKGVIGGRLDPRVTDMKEMLDYAIEKNKKIVGWNVVFDISILLAYGLEELVFKVKWLDGMLLWKHAEVTPEYDVDRGKKQSFGLKECVKQLWPDQAGYEEEIDFHDESPEARKKLHKYNIKDVRFTLKAAEHWWNKLTYRQQTAALIEAECLPWVARANLHGLPLDPLILRELQADLLADADDHLVKLLPFGVTEEVVRSPAQLGKVLFDEWQLPVVKTNVSAKTGKTSRSTDKETLNELSLGFNGAKPDPRVKCIREYREALNANTKFVEGPLESYYYNADGCAHPLAIVFSTYTGRMTYASKQGKNKDERPIGFALHQIKRAKEFREPIGTPPGYDLIEFDAAGQEFKWMAFASQDPVMIQLSQPGEKPHAFMGSRINGDDYQEFRKKYNAKIPEYSGPQGWYMLGKVGNLSLQYRTSKERLRSTARTDYDIPMTPSESEHIWSIYRATYKNVPLYWTQQKNKVRHNGFVSTFAGRRVQVNGDWSRESWQMESTAINYPIQGTGADQKYLAIASLQPLYKKFNAYFAFDLHDGIYSFVPQAHTKSFISEGKKILDNLPYKSLWGIDLPFPMTFDAKHGPCMGMLKDWEG